MKHKKDTFNSLAFSVKIRRFIILSLVQRRRRKNQFALLVFRIQCYFVYGSRLFIWIFW